MPDYFVFADEAGTLAFNSRTSRYFILTTIMLPDYSAGDALLQLRRQLAWEGIDTHPEFRASEERQPVRDRVFAVIQNLPFRIDATIFDKPKLWPGNRSPEIGFYQFAWEYHFKYLASFVIPVTTDRLMVVPATLGERKKKQEAFSNAVRRVVHRHSRLGTSGSRSGGLDPIPAYGWPTIAVGRFSGSGNFSGRVNPIAAPTI